MRKTKLWSLAGVDDSGKAAVSTHLARTAERWAVRLSVGPGLGTQSVKFVSGLAAGDAEKVLYEIRSVRMLSEKLSGDFESAVRDRGAAYASNGSVTKLGVTGTQLVARVSGSEIYGVHIKKLPTGSGWRLLASCTCPYAASDGCCKHVWATLLVADEKTAAKWGTPPKTVELLDTSVDEEDSYDEENDNDDNDEHGYSDDYEDDDGELPTKTSAGLSPGAGRQKHPPAAPTRTWVTFGSGAGAIRASLSQIKEMIDASAGKAKIFLGMPASTQAATPPPQLKPKVPAWKRMLDETRPHHRIISSRAGSTPKPSQLGVGGVWYVIDEEKSNLACALVLDVMRASLRNNPPQGAVMPENLVKLPSSTGDIGQLTNPEDQWICVLLVGAARPGKDHPSYWNYDRLDQRAAQWQLDSNMLAVALPRMAATGRMA